MIASSQAASVVADGALPPLPPSPHHRALPTKAAHLPYLPSAAKGPASSLRRPNTHPVVLAKASKAVLPDNPAAAPVFLPTSTPPVSPAAPQLTINPFVHASKSVGGLFIREDDAVILGLEPVGSHESCYGTVTRYSPVLLSVFSHYQIVNNVFALPKPFDNTEYHDGIMGKDLLLALGFNVAVDRGVIYLQDPDDHFYHRTLVRTGN
ncbi:uncharacterized protein BJ171DRAFT_470625 [Polychytrium aggregatum]|uniref:uncharacterized protein n=1 Tax=Polychytrium aggregatum TaxID=110093 RepID=UPI0022FF21EB|nr:uncharacterized protein BJ171DRAFT_470625 [Polychytrium aggregatum]KAI9209670.1 hypothetical protein BJ171DRAFT_470625 [Polychytrium aggregatum]